MKWLIRLLPISIRKRLMLACMEDLAIDHDTAEKILNHVSKSEGNRVTAFVLKD